MDIRRSGPSPASSFVRLAATLRRGVEVSRVLMRSRAVDLSGLEEDVGRLCAAMLDLPISEAEPLRLALQELLASVNLAISECVASDVH